MVLATVVSWKTLSALATAGENVVAAVSITLWANQHELQLGRLKIPFVILMNLPGGFDFNTIACGRYDKEAGNGSWVYDSRPVSESNLTTCANEDCTVNSTAVTCHAYHLTDFALVSNDLGSASDLFSAGMWETH